MGTIVRDKGRNIERPDRRANQSLKGANFALADFAFGRRGFIGDFHEVMRAERLLHSKASSGVDKTGKTGIDQIQRLQRIMV